jgi:hypothetical protein
MEEQVHRRKGISMTFKDEKDPVVKAALDRVLALRRLTKQTGVKTFKSERAILESLTPEVLAAVALHLDEQQKPTTKDPDNDYSRNFR